MNKKGIEMTISTLVLIVLGIIVLIAMIIAVSGGFKKLNSTTNPFLDTTTNSAKIQACNLACDNSDKIFFCCDKENEIRCSDSKLEINCQKIDCTNFECNSK